MSGHADADSRSAAIERLEADIAQRTHAIERLEADIAQRTHAIESLKAEIAQRSTTRAAADAHDQVRAVETLSAQRAEDLVAQSRYHAERLALYRARMHGSAPTSARHLQELERASQDADRRLRHFGLRS
jgi:tRNA(Leu) C34 or U34 (ribose-2'-O)-methylase TrmL